MSSPSPSDERRAAPLRGAPPELKLDWEEGVFRLLRSWWKRLASARVEPEWNPCEVRLEDHAAAMTLLARAVAEAPLRIRPAREAGGVRGLDLLLPARIGLGPTAESNRRILVVRTAVSAAMHRAERAGAAQQKSDPLEALRAARAALDWLCEALPGFPAEHDEAARYCLEARPALERFEGRELLLEKARRCALRGERPWLDPSLKDALGHARGAGRRSPKSPPILIWGELLSSPLPEDAESEKEAASASGEELPPAQDASEFEAAPVDDILRIELDEKEKGDAVLIHTFEKVETADDYAGGARDTDAADELEGHLEALEEVDLREVLRGGDQAHSLLRSDIQLDADLPQVGRCEPGEKGLLYDEWDSRRGGYRKDWCTVYPTAFGRTKPEWATAARLRHQALIRDLIGRLAVHRSRLEPVDRQPDGEDIDLRAVVEEHAARRAAHGGNTRLYTRRARKRRDFATTVLLDLSLSTDSWVEGRRVLDVAREAVLVLGEVSAAFGDRIQVLAFASHTRNHCRVWEICGWKDAWELGRARLGALEPQGYTRIGPALRHATMGLAAEPADARLLLLVSDGKPTDYDRYEGRYGIADVRQALREAGRLDVVTHALAVDRIACDYLPAMFGPGGWHILPHAKRLPEALTTVYGRFTGR